MINARLVYFLEKNHLISDFQSGFRKGRNTTDLLLRLETKIRNAFVRGEHVVSVFFDLEKAYDTTWKYGILRDLHDAGLRGKLPIFIQNFLKDRTFRVRLGSTLSECFQQEMGVPQGCILSVILFILKFNKIADIIPSHIEKSLFVDDFSITCSSKYIATAERQIQLCINKIQQWANQNGFRFSKTKTNCVHFCNVHGLHPDPSISIDGVPIPVVPEAKFLGVIFDRKLNYKSHIAYLRNKCQSALNVLRVVSKMDWGADKKVLLRLYRALVRSKLDYGCPLYSSARPSYLRKIFPVANQGLRLYLGAFRTSPWESLHAEAGELPLWMRWRKLAMQYVLKLKSNPSNPAYSITFRPQYRHFYTSKPSAIPSFGFRIEDDLHECCPDIDQVMQKTLSTIPPWKLCKPTVDLSLLKRKHECSNPAILKELFKETHDKYQDHCALYTDGSKQDIGTSAAVIFGKRQLKCRLHYILHSRTQSFIVGL
jgi:hypothetical protein